MKELQNNPNSSLSRNKILYKLIFHSFSRGINLAKVLGQLIMKFCGNSFQKKAAFFCISVRHYSFINLIDRQETYDQPDHIPEEPDKNNNINLLRKI
jgi:hypothetical protein